jgi:AcrR family transcriptional regulator
MAEAGSANHRGRLLAACEQEVQERGYGATTVAHISKTAGVSRRTFYEQFDDKEACFLAVYDYTMDDMRGRVFAAFEDENEWPEQVRAGLVALLAFLAEQPKRARLCFVEPLAAGPPVSSHHREAVASFAVLLSTGSGRDGIAEPPAGTEEAVVAGIASLITRWIVTERAGSERIARRGYVD